VPITGLLVTHSEKQQEVLKAVRLHYKGISVLFFSCSILSNCDSKASLFTVMTHTVSSLATKLQPSLTDYTRAAVTGIKQRVLSKENRKTHLTRILTLIIYNSVVKSVLIYGVEIWSSYEDDRRRINATEMAALRRSARISKLDRKTNKYVY
jgi:hypothetical protein